MAMWFPASARLRCEAGKPRTSSAGPLPTHIDHPMPCAIWARTSHVDDGASAETTEPAAKPARPPA